MSVQRFDVVYQGKIIAPDREQVVNHFAQLFSIDIKRASQLLDAECHTLKRDLDKNRALAYQKKLSAIGVLVTLEPRAAVDRAAVDIADVNIEALITLEPEEQTENLQERAVDPKIHSVPREVFSTNTPGTSDEASETTLDASLEKKSKTTLKAHLNSGQGAIDYDQLSVAPVEATGLKSVHFSTIEDTSKVSRVPFDFTGEGREYFKIWLVNTLLTVLTLGIYSAWASVRSKQYLYRHTRLGEESFDYRAKPLDLLKGRLVALLALALATASSWYWLEYVGVVAAIAAVLLPVFIWRYLIYERGHTAFGGLRFHFKGSLYEALLVYSLMLPLALLSGGLLLPYFLYLQRRYFITGSRFAVDDMCLSTPPRIYFQVYLAILAMSLMVAGLAYWLWQDQIVVAILTVVGGYSIICSYRQVTLSHALAAGVHLGEQNFASNIKLWPYFSVHLVNTVLTLLTLGLFYPWAKLRLLKLQAESGMMLCQGRLAYYLKCCAERSTESPSQ